jgi:hypothetical protein
MSDLEYLVPSLHAAEHASDLCFRGRASGCDSGSGSSGDGISLDGCAFPATASLSAAAALRAMAVAAASSRLVPCHQRLTNIASLVDELRLLGYGG